MIKPRRLYIGISRTRRIHADGGGKPLQFDYLQQSNTPNKSTVTTKTTHHNEQLTYSLSPDEKESLKSDVKRLISTDSYFLTWLTRLVCASMPQPISNTDPTPAEAANMRKSSKSGGKRAKGSKGAAVTQAAGTTTNLSPVPSPIRHAGSKRGMATSPHTSPVKGNPFKDINKTGEDVPISLSPLNLEEKLAVLQNKKDLTPYEVKKLMEDPEWSGQMWEHKDFGSAFETGADDMVFAEANYVFTKGDDNKFCNLLKIQSELCKRAAKCKEPSNSSFHFSKGPFKVRTDKLTSITVLDNADKVLLSLPAKQYGLWMSGFEFDLEDITTHEVLCKINISRLEKRMLDLRKGGGPLASLASNKNGPFLFKLISAGKVGLYSQLGVVACLNFDQLSAEDTDGKLASAPTPQETRLNRQ